MERNTESPRRFGPGIVALPDSVQRGVLWGVQRNKEWNGLSVAELFASIAACPDNPEATGCRQRCSMGSSRVKGTARS